MKELNEPFTSLLLGDLTVSIKSSTVTTEQENVLVSLGLRKSSPTAKYLKSEMKIGNLHGKKYDTMESSSAYPTFRKLHLAKQLNMTEKEMDNVEKDFAKAAGSVNTETEKSSSKKQKVDKGESAESKEKAKHAMSVADAKTFKQEVLSEIQEMMLYGVETERVTWLKDRSREVLTVAMGSSSLYSEAALGTSGDDYSVLLCRN